MLWLPARLTGSRQRHRKEVCVSMTGAMYAAIGGLKSHMTKLNVIGNNVANVNTHGYKAQRMTFQESIYTTSKSGSNGGVTLGGNNPSQIGYGCSVGSIDLNMSPSTYAPTGVGLDCMLTGEGFFMVGDKIDYTIEETGEAGTKDYTRTVTGSGIRSASDLTEPLLTRVGNFWVDPDGYICNRDNKVLYGFARVQNPNYKPGATKADIAAAQAEKPPRDLESETIISTELVPLRVPLSAAAPTEENGGRIPASGTDPTAADYVAAHNLWEEGDPVYPFLSAATGGENRYASYKELPSVVNPDAAGSQAAPGKTQIAVAQNTNENRVSDEMPVQLTNMQIGTDGSIYGTAANGKTVVVGYVAIASADSPDGVTHMDGSYYKAMGGAGNLRVKALVDLPGGYLGNQAETTAAGAGGADTTVTPPAADAILTDSSNSIKNGGLEASSTDIANEFAEMITTQRGYQANTRIITVTDSMLEELVNMKR